MSDVSDNNSDVSSCNDDELKDASCDASRQEEEVKVEPSPVCAPQKERKKSKKVKEVVKTVKPGHPIKDKSKEVAHIDIITEKPGRPIKDKSKIKKKKEVYMTWGKYKGKTVKDMIAFDAKYARWLMKQEFVTKFDDIYKVLLEHVPANADSDSD